MSHRRIFLACVLLLGLLPCAGQTLAQNNTTPTDFSELDRFIEQEMERSHIPGTALTVFSESKVLHQGNYGVSDPDGRAVTAQTPFVVGSLSKMITAYAILQLVDQGRLDLDAPVHNYLSWFHPISLFGDDPITVRHLVSHTSGISPIDGIDFRRKYAELSLSELLQTYEHLQLNRPVGGEYQYSNANYNLLGGIIQEITGQPYAHYITNHVYARFDMEHSHVALSTAIPDGLATGHQLWFRRPKACASYPFVDGFLPSMTLMLSSEDMAKFLRVTLTNRTPGGKAALSDETWAMLYQPMVKAYLDEFTGEYAFGCLLTELHEKRIIFCQGGYKSFRAYVFILPDDRMGFAIMMNLNTGYSAQGLTTISRNVLSYLTGGDLSPTEPDPEYFMWLAVPIVMLLIEAVRVIVAVILMWRWYKGLGASKTRLRRILLSLTLPLLIDLGVIYAFMCWLPRSLGIPLSTMMFVQPDLCTLLYVICAVFAAVGVLRTVCGAHLLIRQNLVDSAL